MSPSELAAAGDLLSEVVVRLREERSGDDSEVIASLAATRELAQLVAQIQVEAVAALQRSGAFAAAGHRRPESAVMAVLGVDRGAARGIVRAAEHVVAGVDPQGEALPARLPALGAAFRAGTAGLEHVERIVRLVDSAAVRRIPPHAWRA